MGLAGVTVASGGWVGVEIAVGSAAQANTVMIITAVIDFMSVLLSSEGDGS
ncbi:MAG: hypothetical protein IPK85_05545 [Gemmatimonadetes bacterium]|nr:hypothetical protein [Gemmatimonadota bacterium]